MNARIRKLSTVLFILVFMFSVFYPVKLCVGGEQHTEHVTVGTEEFLDEGGGRGEEMTGKLHLLSFYDKNAKKIRHHDSSQFLIL